MKKQELGFIAIGSILVLIFLNYIDPLLQVFIGKNTNKYTLETSKVQKEVNDILVGQEPQNTSAIGFVDTNNIETYEDYDWDDDE